jgi:hypothetical protein
MKQQEDPNQPHVLASKKTPNDMQCVMCCARRPLHHEVWNRSLSSRHPRRPTFPPWGLEQKGKKERKKEKQKETGKKKTFVVFKIHWVPGPIPSACSTCLRAQ